jgi:hypothetical protein
MSIGRTSGTLTLRDRHDATEPTRRAAAARDGSLTDGRARVQEATIDKFTHETAVLKRLRFAARSEAFNAEQKSLLEKTIDAELAALQAELDKVRPGDRMTGGHQQPRREKLPAHLPRREVHHEPESTTCGCGCALERIREDVAEKLDYAPGVLENQIRPIALGRNNWLFAGSQCAGNRAAAVMSLVHWARLNGHDPCAYLADVLERLPTQLASRVQELLLHRWQLTIHPS